MRDKIDLPFIDLGEKEEEAFKIYKEKLLYWNEKMNLTRVPEDEIYEKHFEDSLSLFKTGLIKPGKSLIDLGTGAGFPGLPLKIVEEGLDLTLMDSLNKRLIFLEDLIESLDLKDVKLVHARAEEKGRDISYREKYDLVTSRALAPLNTLLEYSLPFLKIGGTFIAMKGKDYIGELDEAKGVEKVLGAEIEDILTFERDYGSRALILYKKKRPSPKKYPRGQGKPKKAPLSFN